MAADTVHFRTLDIRPKAKIKSLIGASKLLGQASHQIGKQVYRRSDERELIHTETVSMRDAMAYARSISAKQGTSQSS